MSSFLNKALLRSPLPLLGLLYFLSAKGHLEIIDTEYSVRTALAIVEEGSMLIDVVDPQVLEIAPKVRGTDKIYSQYGLGLVVIFLPVVVLGKIIAAIGGVDQRVLIDFLLSFYNVPFAFLGLWFFRSILLKLGASVSHANAFMLFLAFSTAYWKYSVTDFSEITQAAFLLGALHSVLGDDRRKWRKASLWCSLLVAMKLVYIVLLPLFALYTWFEKTDGSTKAKLNKIVDFSICLIPMGVLLATANYVRFGSILETGYGTQGSSFSFSYFQRDWFDYLFSTQRGIIPFNPVLLASLPTWFAIPKKHRKFFLLIISICICWYGLMCFWKSLQGGYCWGNRLLVPILPLLMLPLAFLNFKSHGTRFLLWLLVPISVLIQLATVSTKIHECSVLRNKITQATSLKTPNQLPSTLRLFTSKLFHAEPIYAASEIGVTSEKQISLLEFDSFYGFNFWPVHLLNYMKLQYAIAFAGNFILVVIIGIIGFLFYRILPDNSRQQ
ncbi:MAG: hypothetical protein VX130_00595 [Verrucomicrobiota bacterium]|nr:hypothetical protein [Verrucomicrobiota bacterium]